jgi:hypothetical protein
MSKALYLVLISVLIPGVIYAQAEPDVPVDENAPIKNGTLAGENATWVNKTVKNVTHVNRTYPLNKTGFVAPGEEVEKNITQRNFSEPGFITGYVGPGDDVNKTIPRWRNLTGNASQIVENLSIKESVMINVTSDAALEEEESVSGEVVEAVKIAISSWIKRILRWF